MLRRWAPREPLPLILRRGDYNHAAQSDLKLGENKPKTSGLAGRPDMWPTRYCAQGGTVGVHSRRKTVFTCLQLTNTQHCSALFRNTKRITTQCSNVTKKGVTGVSRQILIFQLVWRLRLLYFIPRVIDCCIESIYYDNRSTAKLK